MTLPYINLEHLDHISFLLSHLHNLREEYSDLWTKHTAAEKYLCHECVLLHFLDIHYPNTYLCLKQLQKQVKFLFLYDDSGSQTKQYLRLEQSNSHCLLYLLEPIPLTHLGALTTLQLHLLFVFSVH